MILRFLKYVYNFKVQWRRSLTWRFLCQFDTYISIKTIQGRFSLPTDPRDIISSHLYVFRGFEYGMANTAIKFCRELRSLEKGKGTILDIGANNGVISIGMLTNNEIERAVCVEVEETNYKRLNANIHLNGLQNQVDTFNVAMTDEEKTVELEISDYDKGDHRIRMQSLTKRENNKESKRRTTHVPGTSLDRFIEENQIDVNALAVIWIDTQGHEGYIFKGATKTVASGVPIFSEVSPYLILRAGMSTTEFAQIVVDTFNVMWVLVNGIYEKQPINYIYEFMKRLTDEGPHDDVIFQNQKL